MKRILLGLLFALAMAGGAHAQTISATTVASCGAQTFGSSTFQPVEMDLTGNLCTNAASGSGITIGSPLGGLGQTDASGVRVSFSGTVPTSWVTPCTGGLGDAGFFACMITQMGQPIPPQTAAAVPIGGVVICDAASTANPCAPAATVKAASTAAAATDKPLVVIQSPNGVDPCSQGSATKVNYPISGNGGTFAIGPAGTGTKKIYICSLFLIAPSAVAISLAEGSGTTCGTSAQAGVIGVATNGTASQGPSFAANGGFTLGNGAATVAATATGGNYLCIFQSGTAYVAGNMMAVQQ